MPPKPYALRKRLSSETVAELIGAYRAGATTPELAEHYGVAKSALLELLHKEGLAQRRKLTACEVEQAKDLRGQGWTYAAIGTQLGVYGSTIWRALQG